MNINLTPAQYTELEVLILALQNPKSSASAVTIIVEINSTKITYGSSEVKVKLTG